MRVARLEVLRRPGGRWRHRNLPDGWRGAVARYGFSKVSPAPRAFRWWDFGRFEIRWHYDDDPLTVDTVYPSNPKAP